jgi:DNA-binding response OmpR family regulator
VRLELEKLGFNVTDAVNGRDGLLKGRSFPPKDIILVADTLRVDMNAEQLIEELKADVRTRYVPYAILHDRATRTASQARFGTEMLLVEREMQGEDLRAAINAVDRRRSSEAAPKRRAEQIAVTCATALSRVDPRATHLVLNDAVPADLSHKATIGDVDKDGVPDLMVKFSREALQQHLVVGPDQRVVVSGSLSDGTMFVGYDVIAVIDGGAKG